MMKSMLSPSHRNIYPSERSPDEIMNNLKEQTRVKIKADDRVINQLHNKTGFIENIDFSCQYPYKVKLDEPVSNGVSLIKSMTLDEDMFDIE